MNTPAKTKSDTSAAKNANASRLTGITRTLSINVDRLAFHLPITHVYNPLRHARRGHDAYVNQYGQGKRDVLLLGMNPGPWGMVQTGVPFGEVNLVREWLGIEVPIGKPDREHPKRPVDGFACTRSEVSGRRLWGWARDTFDTPHRFFDRFFVINYCPLTFMEESGRNVTPDKLPKAQRDPLFKVCDDALSRVVEHFNARWVIGIGAFAAKRARTALTEKDVAVGQVLHPSPASPAANRGWPNQATKQLHDLLGDDLTHPAKQRRNIKC